METEFVPFGSTTYWVLLALLNFARGADFLSTWMATPNLLLEANPIAKRLGWKLGILLNLVMAAAFARWPLPAIVIITTSLLVAARNLQSAWLMRSLGELGYRAWMAERLASTNLRFYLFSLFAQAVLTAIVGVALILFAREVVCFGIGVGVVTYALAVAFYTLLSVWRLRGLSIR